MIRYNDVQGFSVSGCRELGSSAVKGKVIAEERKLTSMNWPPRNRGSAQPSSSLGGSIVRVEGRKGDCMLQVIHSKGNGIARAAEERARKERAGSMAV